MIRLILNLFRSDPYGIEAALADRKRRRDAGFARPYLRRGR